MFIFELDKVGKTAQSDHGRADDFSTFSASCQHFFGKKNKKFFSKFRLTKYVGYDIMESLGAPKESAPPFYHFQIDLSSTFFKKNVKLKIFSFVK